MRKILVFRKAEQPTLTTLVVKPFALAGMVANAGAGPHVVQCPYHGLARGQYLLKPLQRQHPLIYPMQVDDVRFAELRQAGNVGATVGNGDGKEVLPAETILPPDDKPLPQEVPPQPPRSGQGHGSDMVGLFVAHQHFGLHSVVVQGFGQPIGCHGSTTGTLGCIDNENSHGSMLQLFGCEDRKKYAFSQ